MEQESAIVENFHNLYYYEAVEEFLETHKEFAVDDTREKFLLTFNPRGYLRRIA